MPARPDRVVLVLALCAVALAVAYGAYLAPEWDPGRDDQIQYLALARGLVDRGEYTRATVGEPFIPEPLRFPGYPLFLAPLCAIGCSRWLITIAQALLLGALVLIVGALASRLLDRRGARASAALVALYPAYPFFAAHVLSDLLATVLSTATVLVSLALLSRPSRGIAAGALWAATALTRPFLLFVLPVSAALALAPRGVPRRAAVAVAAAAIVFAMAVAPFVVYEERAFGRPVVGSTGAQLWLGYFQGLDVSSLDAYELAEVDAGRAALARFDATTDRVAQSAAFVALDDELRARALALIGHDPFGFAARGVTRSIVLWTGDIPLRPEHATGAAVWIWVVANLVFLGLGLVGAVQLARRGGIFAIPLAIVLATWVLSYPLWAEGRFSLPARPFLGIGVAAVIAGLRRERRV